MTLVIKNCCGLDQLVTKHRAIGENTTNELKVETKDREGLLTSYGQGQKTDLN